MKVKELARPAATAVPVKVIAVTSGKGGVGKTTVAINLALALTLRKRRVLLMDANMGLANIDVLLGLKPLRNLSHVVAGACELKDIVIDGPHGLSILPGASGVQRMAELSEPERVGLVYAFSTLDPIDVLVIDTPAGIGGGTLTYCEAAQEVMIVVCDDPASLTDAYAIIKLLHQNCGRRRFRVLVNMALSVEEGQRLFQRLVDTAGRCLDVVLDLVAILPYDSNVLRGSQQYRAVLDAYPSSSVAAAFHNLGAKADGWSVPVDASGRLEFFAERFIHTAPAAVSSRVQA